MEKTEVSRENILSTVMEGGGFDIYRIVYEDGSIKFVESTSEIFGADDLDMTQEEFEKFMKRLKRTYDTFEEFWKDFSQKRRIEKMHYILVADEYKDVIRNSVQEKLKLNGFSEEEINKQMNNRFKNRNFI